MVAELSKYRLLRALLRQPVDCTPIWIMRQAGRYLPEYNALRKQVPNFMTFCKTPELAATATMQPIARFPLDAAIIFSDILVIPEAMGMQLEFHNGVGPIIHNPIRNQRDVERLRLPEVNEALGYVMQAIALVKKELAGRIPLIGFAGSPWTCATYMIEGQSSKTFETIKRMLYANPELLHTLLSAITQLTIAYLQAQISAGAEVLMLFDTWGGVLAHREYQQFSLGYMQQIAAALRRPNDQQPVPLIFFTKGGGNWLEQIAESGCDAVGIDWTVNIADALQRVGQRVAIQGNLDPALLFAEPVRIEQEVQQLLQAVQVPTGHVFNLGHGISQHTPVEHVQVLVDAVHRYGIKPGTLKTQQIEINS